MFISTCMSHIQTLKSQYIKVIANKEQQFHNEVVITYLLDVIKLLTVDMFILMYFM